MYCYYYVINYSVVPVDGPNQVRIQYSSRLPFTQTFRVGNGKTTGWQPANLKAIRISTVTYLQCALIIVLFVKCWFHPVTPGLPVARCNALNHSPRNSEFKVSMRTWYIVDSVLNFWSDRCCRIMQRVNEEYRRSNRALYTAILEWVRVLLSISINQPDCKGSSTFLQVRQFSFVSLLEQCL
jgi:hypothetical protein